mmetsp:Transcript_6168/g.15319  ORF Transcript_6168/g.15319 Transcript_6168/m.15319 type:complete len:171 (+) Transcript_6168:2-514(+)
METCLVMKEVWAKTCVVKERVGAGESCVVFDVFGAMESCVIAEGFGVVESCVVTDGFGAMESCIVTEGVGPRLTQQCSFHNHGESENVRIHGGMRIFVKEKGRHRATRDGSLRHSRVGQIQDPRQRKASRLTKRKMFVCGKQLEDGVTLSNYNIRNKQYIYLVAKTRNVA